MIVYKFGGASVKDARAVKNVASIIKEGEDAPMVVVISAMGKTTNALESLLDSFFYKKEDAIEKLNLIKEFHFGIAEELFDKNHAIFQELHNVFVEVEWQLEDEPIGTYDFEYDQMVGIGEQLSTKLVSAYLTQVGIHNKWLDARSLIRTDNSYRRAIVDWQVTEDQIQDLIVKHLKESDIVITQGFVGSTSENFSSTLGREGSDFSAAIIAACTNAKEVFIWKDVDGMLNADPKYFEKTIKLNNISYREAIELAYFGASIIHPKTIKPLQNKGIPLRIKSFVNPEYKGTIINSDFASDTLIPSYIHKPNQRLISISAKDFSFITEGNLSEIYACFSKHGIAISLMQNSAISFSVCVDEDPKLELLIAELKTNFKVVYNKDLTLLTIRHYSEDLIHELIAKKKVLLEQKSRSTVRLVLGT
jgi:aspartate kinase